MEMREKLNKLREWMKLFLLVVVMSLGFFLIFGVIWTVVGGPWTNLVLWWLYGASLLATDGYIYWASDRGKEVTE